MDRIIITNKNGESITLGNHAPYILEKFDGGGEVDVIIESQKAPRQDGSTYLDNVLNDRAITIEGTIVAKGKSDAVLKAKRLMQRVLNPKAGEVIITYQQGNQIREITGIAEKTPFFPGGQGKKGLQYQKFLLHLICHQPFWLSKDTNTKEVITWIGGKTFPWRLPSSFAMKGPKIVNIVNQGDVETPVRIIIGGPATNPKLINKTTSQHIQVNQKILTNEELIITTDFGSKRVEVNGQNAFNWIDISSYFWQLQPGDNVIEYTSDDPTEPAVAVMYYRHRYVGI